MIGSHLRVADETGGFTRRETPLFDLGTLPAGNLYSSVGDLARFVMALAAGGRGLVKPETLAEMWRPQLTTNSTGFGLGFSIGKFRDHRSVSHSGAVYGHSTSLVLLPAEKLGVIVLANEDIVNGRVRRISQTALSLLLQAKLLKPLPETPVTFAHESLADFTGEFESPSFWARLEVREGKLSGNISGQPTRFTPRSPLTFVADSRLDDATPVVFERDALGKVSGFTLGGQRYQRTPSNRPPLPPEWQAYLGSYGSDLIPVILSARQGRLYAMTENMVDYALTPMNRQVCALPEGMYVDEHLVFLTDPGGNPWAINFANMILRRRP